MFVFVFVLVFVTDQSFRPTRMAADTVDYDYEHRCAEHERLGAVSAGSGINDRRRVASGEDQVCHCHHRRTQRIAYVPEMR